MSLPFAIDQMMNGIYSAQEQRWADEQELRQQEYEIALGRRPGPVSLEQYREVFGYVPVEVKGRLEVAGVLKAVK